MNISEVLQLKYPNADFLIDIQLKDEGDGIFIYVWDVAKLGKKPTKTQLKNWLLDEELQKQVYNNEVLATRKAQYGSWQQQLDMLYHDKKDGTTTWLDHVVDVKTRYPKPSQAE